MFLLVPYPHPTRPGGQPYRQVGCHGINILLLSLNAFRAPAYIVRDTLCGAASGHGRS